MVAIFLISTMFADVLVKDLVIEVSERRNGSIEQAEARKRELLSWKR